MRPVKLLTRKELSAMTGLTYDQIRKNEAALGLDLAKRLIARCVRYDYAVCLRELSRRGIVIA